MESLSSARPCGTDARAVPPTAFTLVELLVVIAIIATLLGLLLPAVQAARESARRTQCMVNMRQVALAFQLCHDAKNYLPAACYTTAVANTAKYPQPPEGNPSRREHSWRMLVMPYLEEKEAAEKYDWKKHWFIATSNRVPATPISTTLGVPPDSNLGISLRPVAVFRCPSAPAPPSQMTIPQSPDTDSSRPLLPVKAAPGPTDYDCMTGVKKGVLAPDPYAAGGENSVGMLDKDRVTRLRQVTDGLTKTLLIVEAAGRPFIYQAGRPVMSGTGQAINQCVGWADNLGPFKLDSIRPTGAKGATANQGVPMNATNDGECYSFHQGGMCAAFGDTSTRFLSDSVDLRLFCGIVTRAGNEQTGELP